jgi:hypothetical protein
VTRETTRAQLTDAISAHLLWKAQVAYVIAAGVPTANDIALASRDDQCRFGRWLYDMVPADNERAHYAICKRLHAYCHAEALRALRLMSEGQQARALASISTDGDFTEASRLLIEAMKDWRRSK